MNIFCRFVSAILLLAPAVTLRADCSLTSTGNVPLPDLGPGSYRGYPGGLYPNGSNQRPAAHDAAGLAIANQIQPLNSLGQPDPNNGKIVFISVGMSNTTQEFASKGSTAFKPRADADPSKNPQLVIVDGAQGGQDATTWLDPNAPTWATVDQRLAAAGVAPAQVQVAWVKQALASPRNYGAFPAHAQTLQSDLETIVRNLKTRYPNVRIAYLASRTRAYTNDASTLNPEPFAYESGFSVQWTIADQINGRGNLNFDPSKGAAVAPYLCWGPYLWADGTNPRSDGFTWLCSDVVSDFTHPSNSGVTKVADQLLAFFKTDLTATPWFLKRRMAGSPPHVTASVTPANGTTNLIAQFNASAADSDGAVTGYVWTFDDGTFSFAQNPMKIFSAPGSYNNHLTVIDNAGDYTAVVVPITVGTAPLANISTRTQVGVGDNVLIGGFIVQGAGSKKLMLRAIGPALSALGVSGPLADPTLELHDASGAVIARNDNWQTTQIGGAITTNQAPDIQASGLAPANTAESAMIVSLGSGNYSAVVRGANNSGGMALVEAYDLDQPAPAKLANISTRGLVQTAEKVLIGGMIVGPSDSAKIIARAIGPSLSQAGIIGALADPTLELRDNNGALIRANDNWRSDQPVEIQATGIPPANDLEAAIVVTLAPGNYTAIVAGKNGGTGIGLVEFYKLE